MKFTREVFLATEILRRAPETPITAKKLAEELSCSELFLQRIISKLSKAGLVEVKLGQGGGVFVDPAHRPTTLLEVYWALGTKIGGGVKKGSFLDSVNTDVLKLFSEKSIPNERPTEGGKRGGRVART